MAYSVGIGLTNACNLQCAHCYRPTDRIDHLSLAQVQAICEAIPVGSMGMGTGENILNPEFDAIVDDLHQRDVKLSIASNGHSLMSMSPARLRAFNDVEVSIDYPTRQQQDALRGDGNWDLVHQAITRCQQHDVPVSILATLMTTNYAQMDDLARLAQQLGVTLRVNVYQAVRTDAFRLTYEQFWEGYRRLLGAAQVVSCSEPIVRAAMGLGDVRSPCGRSSIRFNMRGQVIPCVYWPITSQPFTIADLGVQRDAVLDHPLFTQARAPAIDAAQCACQGGCASRRALNRAQAGHDEYCPWIRGDSIELAWQAAPGMNLVRSQNVCTTIMV